MAHDPSSRAIAERIIDRLQDFLHVASGPNEDGTHSGFVVVDFDAAAEALATSGGPEGAIALLPFDLADEEDPVELSTASSDEEASGAAEDVLSSLLDLIETVVLAELSA